MKKLLNKKVIAAVVALLLALGVCDLTLLEQSNLKPLLHSLQDTAASLFDDVQEVPVDADAPADAQ